MEKKSNKAYTIVRILLAVVFIPNAFVAFFVQPNQMGLNSEAVTVLDSLWATGYIMPTVKIIELIAGIMFLTNKYVQLACILIMPIIINIVLLGVFKEPKGLIISMPILVMIIYLVKENLTTYKPLLSSARQ